MKTIQLALENSDYTKSLHDLLLRDGTHRVFVVDRPDLKLDGVVVIDGNRPESLGILDREPERFVLITRKGSDQLARIWDAGVRHVVFEGDSPSTAHLAIIAAEMRLPRGSHARRLTGSGPFCEGHHTAAHAKLPIIDPPAHCGRCHFKPGHDLF